MFSPPLLRWGFETSFQLVWNSWSSDCLCFLGAASPSPDVSLSLEEIVKRKAVTSRGVGRELPGPPAGIWGVRV